MKDTKHMKGTVTWLHAIGIGIGASAGVMFGLLLLSAICIGNEYFSYELYKKIIPIIYYVSAFVGAIITGALSKDKKIKFIFANTVVLAIILICISLSLYEGISVGIIGNLIAMVVGACSAILLLNRGIPYKKRKRTTSRRR